MKNAAFDGGHCFRLGALVVSARACAQEARRGQVRHEARADSQGEKVKLERWWKVELDLTGESAGAVSKGEREVDEVSIKRRARRTY